MTPVPGVSSSHLLPGQGRVGGGSALAYFLRRFVHGHIDIEEAVRLSGLDAATLRLYAASPLTAACMDLMDLGG